MFLTTSAMITNSVANDLIAAYQSNPLGYLLPAGVAIAVGYIYYIYCFLITVREKKAPLPTWLHCFFLADDVTACVVFYLAAKNHDWFWFFVMFSVGMLIWNFFEVYCIGWTIKHERQLAFGNASGKPVTIKQSIAQVLVYFVVFLGLINFVITFTGDEVMLHMFTVCNILAVTVPPLYWYKRQSRDGASMGWAICNIFIAFTNFLPAGFGWWTTSSDHFAQPWFYACGVIFTAYAIGAAVMLSKFPKKGLLPNGKKPVW